MGSARTAWVGAGLAALLLAGCGGLTSPPAASSVTPSPGHQGARVEATWRTGVTAGAVAVGEGSAWVPNTAEGTLSRIDLRANRIAATIRIGDNNALIQAGCEPGSVHYAPHGSFDIRACDLPSAVATGLGSVWVLKNDNQSVLRLDPKTNQVLALIPVGISPFGIGAGPAGVWVTDFNDDLVAHIDPQTNQLVATIHVAHGPSGVAVGDDTVWVANSRADVVTRIDPHANRVAAVIRVGHTPLPVALGEGSVWVRNESSEGPGIVSRIDPVTSRVVASIAVGQARDPLVDEGLVQALNLAGRDAEQGGRLGVDEGAGFRVAEDGGATLLRSVQDHPVPHGVTESLLASGVTDSLYFHKMDHSYLTDGL